MNYVDCNDKCLFQNTLPHRYRSLTLTQEHSLMLFENSVEENIWT